VVFSFGNEYCQQVKVMQFRQIARIAEIVGRKHIGNRLIKTALSLDSPCYVSICKRYLSVSQICHGFLRNSDEMR
jgi:hypothetical protein